jgi:2-polyprenyl-3-methyl-5-hydroxy-6-metoxy-1,4-benzoquinol methylase
MSASRQKFAEARFIHAWMPSRFDLTRAARLREVLAQRPHGRILDVGCYDGQFIAQVVDQRDGDKVIGLDIAHAALRAAQTRGLVAVRGQVEAALPFAANSFATIVAAEVIEHVFDTQAVLLELARILETGGWLALTTPNLVALSSRAQLVLGRSPHNVEFDAGPGTSGHIRYFTFDTLERLLRRAGLKPLGRWTNVAHFSMLGSSELVGRLRPTLGHTLISLAQKSEVRSQKSEVRSQKSEVRSQRVVTNVPAPSRGNLMAKTPSDV